jgi:hypothetical protein
MTSEEYFYKKLPTTLKLSNAELEKLSTPRLLKVFAKARAFHSNVLSHFGDRCCEECNEYIGLDWENDINRYAKVIKPYKEKIKNILSKREHVIRKPNSKIGERKR